MTDEIDPLLEPEYEDNTDRKYGTDRLEAEGKEDEKDEQGAVDIQTEPDTTEQKYEKTKTALRQEREEARALRHELESARGQLQQFITLKEDLENFRKSQKTEDDKKIQEEQFNENPAQFLKEQQDKIMERLDQDEKVSKEEREQIETMQQIELTVAQQVHEFKKDNPNYDEAFEYCKNHLMKQYELQGIPTGQWGAAFNRDCQLLSVQAINKNINAGQLVLDYASLWGYAPKKDDKVDRLERGAQAAQSHSGGGQQEDSSKLKEISEMDDDEFNKMWAEMERAAKVH